MKPKPKKAWCEMADWIEKTVFGFALSLILGCQIHPENESADMCCGQDDRAARLMAEKQRQADEALRLMLEVYEQDNYNPICGDAEAYHECGN